MLITPEQQKIIELSALVSKMERENRELRGELNGNRDDAARYRWLCSGHGYFMEESGLCNVPGLYEKDRADGEIDAARKE